MGPKKTFPYECSCGCPTRKTIRNKHQEYTHLYSSMEARARIAADPSKICDKYRREEQKRFENHCVHVGYFAGVAADILLANREMKEIFVRMDRAPLHGRSIVTERFVLENFTPYGIWKGVRESLISAGKWRSFPTMYGGSDSDSDEVEMRPMQTRAAKVSRDSSEDVCAEEPPTKVIRLEPSGEKEEVKQAIGIHHELLRRASLVTPRGVEPPALKLVQFDPDFISNLRRDLASFVRKPVEESKVEDDSVSFSFVPITRQDVVDVEAYSTCTEDRDDNDSVSDLSGASSLDCEDDVGVLVEDTALEATSPVERPPSLASGSAESLSMLADCAAAMCKKPVCFEICIQPADMEPVIFVVPTKPGKRTPLLEFGIVSLEAPRSGRGL